MGRGRVCDSGFTLLEVVVVLALIGIITGIGLVGLKLPASAAPAAAAIDRLAVLIEQQHFEAGLLGEQRGLRFTRSGYLVQRYDPAQRRWLTTSRLQPLAAALRPQLSIDGRAVALNDGADGVDGADGAPQLLLLSNGEASDFRIELGNVGDRYRLDGDLLGRLEQSHVGKSR